MKYNFKFIVLNLFLYKYYFTYKFENFLNLKLMFNFKKEKNYYQVLGLTKDVINFKNIAKFY